MALREALPPLDSRFNLAVGWQRFSQVVSHGQPKLLGGVFLLDLRFQLEALFTVKAVWWREGKWLLSQEALQSGAPGIQHGGAGLSRSMNWSPEDLRGQNLEAAVMQDAVLQRDVR